LKKKVLLSIKTAFLLNEKNKESGTPVSFCSYLLHTGEMKNESERKIQIKINDDQNLRQKFRE
jgi:hypothetical protein